MAGPDLVNIVIDGKPISVPKGEMVIESARRVGVEIPHFCYHRRLSKEAGANCRMCLVEVSMPRKAPDGTVSLSRMPKPQTSCSLPAAEGMVVETETPAIVEARRGILEFLLINHPLDCPICDRGGECPLQNNTLRYGPAATRFSEEKRHHPKAYSLSEHVVFDRERCIHCARCTRFTADISGDSQLGFLKRGADMEVGVLAGTDFTSLFSGNVIELCPVGALLSRDYRFRARPWDLSTQKSICTECSNGCNIKLDHRARRLVRVNARTNEGVNEEWTCDRGKFGMAYVSSPDRLRHPLIRMHDRFVESSWTQALDIVAERLAAAGPTAGFLGGSRSSNEDLYLAQMLFRQTLGSANLDHRTGPVFPPAARYMSPTGGLGLHSTIAELEGVRTALVFSADLAVEQPMLFLRLRKAWVRGACRIVEVQPDTAGSSARANRVAEFALASAPYGEGQDADAAWDLVGALLAERPELAPGLPASVRERCQERAGVRVASDALRKVAAGLGEPPIAILCGEAVRRSPRMLEVLEALSTLGAALGAPSCVSLPCREVNEQGAADMGILPDAGPGYGPVESSGLDASGILAGVAAGKVRALWVCGTDYATEFHDRSLATRALEASSFTVYSGLTLNATASTADVVLPVCSVAERDGTYTNVERRVQRFHRAYQAEGDVREEWRIAAAVGMRLGADMPFADWSEVLAAILTEVAGYSGCSADRLGEHGIVCTRPGQEGTVS